MPDDSRRTASETPPAQMADEAEITAYDRAIAPRFWGHYGTPLFRALLNAREAKL